MKYAIRYFTKSKKGNTIKLANVVEKVLNVEKLPVSHNLDEKTDVLFLINAMYAASIDKEVKTFLEKNKDNIGSLVNVSSSASGKSTYNLVKKECDKNGIVISDKEYHTVASWIFINKDRPNEEDLRRLEDFVKGFLNE